MPQALRRYLSSHSLRYHLTVALLLGLLLRLCTAWFVYGPQALDDYLHGVLPAWQLFTGHAVTLPDYRSYLLVWLLDGFLQLAAPFGVHSSLAMVRVMYAGLGVVSLLAVVGTYLYAQRRGTPLFGALALYLMALHPAMPFIGTRAFGEAVALPLVVLGIALLERVRRGETKRRDLEAVAGFLILGLAALFRYQVGLVYLAYALILLLERRWRLVALWVGSGFATLGLEALIDILSGRGALSTFFNYLHANAGGAASFGVMPWYNTWLFMLGLTLFPFSLVFWDQLGRLWREHRPLVLVMLVFVAAHSLVPHKEERFLYPVVGLLWIALAAVWSYVPERRSVRWVYAPVFALFVLLTLPLALFSNTQSSNIAPLARAGQRFDKVVFLDYDARGKQDLVRAYFLQPPNLQQRPQIPPSATLIDETLARHPGYPAVVLLATKAQTVAHLRQLAGISSSLARCEALRSAGSLVDQWLYELNPKFNRRRRMKSYLVCVRKP